MRALGGMNRIAALAATLTVALASTAPAHASVPGRNGVLALRNSATAGVLAIDPAGGPPTTLLPGCPVPDGRIAWAPGGATLAFAGHACGGSTADDLFVADAGTGVPHQITFGAGVFAFPGPSFSPDGHRLVYLHQVPLPFPLRTEVHVVDA